MKILEPTTIDGAILTSSNVGETVSEWLTGTYYLAGDSARIDSSHEVYESQVGDAPATITMTIASPCVVTHTAHGMADNDPVEFTTTGALPTGLTAGVTYYISAPTADTYRIAATSGGAEINTSGSQSGTHTAHGNPNRGQDPEADAGAYWVAQGSSNKWRMFDPYLESVTTNAGNIAVVFEPTGRIDAMAFFNMDAGSINITITDEIDGEVYNEDHSLSTNTNVSDWHSYYFSPIIRKSDLLIEGLPLYVAPEIAVTITNSGGTAECGLLVAGRIRDTGATVYGAGFGILDSSRKEVDDFGRTSLVERSYRRTGSLRVIVQRSRVDEVADLLAERRAVPSVFSATGDFGTALIYGFPRDWRMKLEQYQQAGLEIEIEGMA